MTENQEMRARALELAIRYLEPKGALTSKELADIRAHFERELIPVAKVFEGLISRQPPKLGME